VNPETETETETNILPENKAETEIFESQIEAESNQIDQSGPQIEPQFQNPPPLTPPHDRPRKPNRVSELASYIKIEHRLPMEQPFSPGPNGSSPSSLASQSLPHCPTSPLQEVTLSSNPSAPSIAITAPPAIAPKIPPKVTPKAKAATISGATSAAHLANLRHVELQMGNNENGNTGGGNQPVPPPKKMKPKPATGMVATAVATAAVAGGDSQFVEALNSMMQSSTADDHDLVRPSLIRQFQTQDKDKDKDKEKGN